MFTIKQQRITYGAFFVVVYSCCLLHDKKERTAEVHVNYITSTDTFPRDNNVRKTSCTYTTFNLLQCIIHCMSCLPVHTPER